MRTPPRALTLAMTLPFLGGCFAVLPAPLPPASERSGTEIRGVVLRGEGGAQGERIEFAEVYETQWLDGGLSLTGGDGPGLPTVTQQFRYQDLWGVLRRQVDPTRTSLLIGGVMLGALATLAFIINAKDAGSSITIVPAGN